jgi:hypothetical protein
MPVYSYDYYICLYNYAHFSHILVLSHIFLGIVCFSKKHHSLDIITFLSSTKYLQSFLCKCDYNEENLKQILRFCKLLFSLIMLMLLSVQIVQTNNNELS